MARTMDGCVDSAAANLALSVDTQESKLDASGSSDASSAAEHVGSTASSGNLRDHGTLTRHNLESIADIGISVRRLAPTSPLSLLLFGTTTRSTATSPHGTLPRRPTSCRHQCSDKIFAFGESAANDPPSSVSPKSEPVAGTSSLYETPLLGLGEEQSASPSPTSHTSPSPNTETQNCLHSVCNSPRGPEMLRRSPVTINCLTHYSFSRTTTGRPKHCRNSTILSTAVPGTVRTPSLTATASISRQFQVERVTTINSELHEETPDDTARNERHTNPFHSHDGNALNPFATPQRPNNTHPSLSNVSRDRLLRSSRHDRSR